MLLEVLVGRVRTQEHKHRLQQEHVRSQLAIVLLRHILVELTHLRHHLNAVFVRHLKVQQQESDRADREARRARDTVAHLLLDAINDLLAVDQELHSAWLSDIAELDPQLFQV